MTMTEPTDVGSSALPDPSSAAPEFQLPPEAYLDPSFLEREMDRLFHHSWSLVADSAALAEVGAAIPVMAGRCPIVILRTEAGLVAHHNICRHRGMQIVPEPMNCSTLRCSYHGWEWDTAGDLQRVPQRKTQFPDIDTAGLALVPAAVGEWEGMVFVNPDADAPSLAEAMGVMPEGIGSFHPGQLAQVANVRMEVECNWKLFVENHIDVYHLWYLHDRTLADFDHTRFEHNAADGNWTSYEPVKAARLDSIEPVAGAVAIEHIDERDRFGIGAHMMFPNLLMASTVEFFITYAISPINEHRSVIDLRVRAEAGSDPDALVASARSFIDEDIVACEQIQAAMKSQRFAVGPLSFDHERPIEQFQRRLLQVVAEPWESPT